MNNLPIRVTNEILAVTSATNETLRIQRGDIELGNVEAGGHRSKAQVFCFCNNVSNP